MNAKTEDQMRQMRKDTENAIVQVLSDEFGDITAEMSFNQAIGQLKKDIEEQKSSLVSANSTIENQKIIINQLNKMPKVNYSSIGIVMNGLRTEDQIMNGWADINGRNYYSEDVINSLLDNNVLLDGESKTLFYNSTGSSNPKETKVTLKDSNILFDGYGYTYYKRSNPGTISVGSKTHDSGFVLNTRTRTNNAYALFDLTGNYSKMSFDVGKVTGTDNNDATMKIYLDNNFSEEFVLSPAVVSGHKEIELKYSDSLKIEVIQNNYFGTSIYPFIIES